MRRTLRLALGLVAAVLFVAAPVHGQPAVELSETALFQCRLPMPEAGQGTDAFTAHHLAPEAHVLRRGAGQPAANFVVTYEGFSDEARAAFQAAVDVWAQHLTSPEPIRIRAKCESLGTNLLGSAGPYLTRGFSGAPLTNTWYPYALADALASEAQGRPVNLDASRPDIEASFNSGYANWYLGTDGNGPPNQVEFFTVVLHELGHGLGFIGSAAVENGVGSFGLSQAPGVPFVFDRFTEDAQGRSLLDTSVYPHPSAALASALTSAVFFGGSTVEAVHGGPAPLYAPSTWNAGSSYSHFDESTFPASVPDGLMTPLIAPGEKKDSPGPLLCAALQDLGWTLAPACNELISGEAVHSQGVPARSHAASSFTMNNMAGSCAGSVTLGEPFAIDYAGPNPFSGETSLRLTVRDRQRVRAWLFDAAGRRLGTLLDATVAAGGTEVLRVDGAALPSGVYFVRVVGESFAETATVTNIR